MIQFMLNLFLGKTSELSVFSNYKEGNYLLDELKK
jgi:hypothetical protein